MKSLADANAKGWLTTLELLATEGTLSFTEAWNLFSKPTKKKTFKKVTFIIPDVEITSLENLRIQTQTILRRQINKRCAYCKRAMGQHGMSWNIEHIYAKSVFPQKMFSLDNLTYACIDCNLTKNNTVDGVDPYVFDIINPNSAGFNYGAHINFLQLSTENIHILKYHPHSPEGIETYKKMKLQKIEHLEVLGSLNMSVRELSDRIDERLDRLIASGESREVADFLHELKLGLLSE